jgi:hypothetical protein
VDKQGTAWGILVDKKQAIGFIHRAAVFVHSTSLGCPQVMPKKCFWDIVHKKALKPALLLLICLKRINDNKGAGFLCISAFFYCIT